MIDDILQDRDGAGKAMSGKLTNKVGTDSFRTAIIKDGDTTTMLRTKGGMREVTMTKVKPPETGPCVFFPLEEVDEAGEHSQGDRAYYHDHESDEAIPDRRIYTSDGIFSIVAKPTRRMRFKSVGLGKHLDVWFNDHSLPSDEKDPLATGSFEQGSITQEEKDNEVFDLAPVQCVEQLKRSATAKVEAYKSDELAFPDDSDARLQRRYYAPIFLNQESPPESGDKSKLQGLAFLISRIKTLAFKVTGLAGYNGLYKVFFGRYNNNLAAEVYPEEASGGLVERKISERVFAGDIGVTPLLQGLVLRDGTVSIAPPGGLLHPVRLDQWTTLNPMEKVSGDQYLRMSSLSNVVTFGQPWHGLYSGVTRELRSLETDEVIKTFDAGDTWASGGVKSLMYVDFGAKDLEIPANTAFFTDIEKDNAKFKGDAVFYNGRYSLLPGNEVVLDAGGTDSGVYRDFLIKNSDGKVFRLRASTGWGLLIITILERVDVSLLEARQETATVLYQGNPNPNPKTDELSYASNESYEYPYLLRISPDGRKLFACGASVEIVGDIEAGAAVVLHEGFSPAYKAFRDDSYASRVNGTGSPYHRKEFDTFFNGTPIVSLSGPSVYGEGLGAGLLTGGSGSFQFSWDAHQTTVGYPANETYPHGYSLSTGSSQMTCNIAHTITARETMTHSELLDVIYDPAEMRFIPIEQLHVQRFIQTETNTMSASYSDTWSDVVNDTSRVYHQFESTQLTRQQLYTSSNDVTLYVDGVPGRKFSTGGRLHSRSGEGVGNLFVSIRAEPHGPYEPQEYVVASKSVGIVQQTFSDWAEGGSDILGVRFGVGAIVDGPTTPYGSFDQRYFGNSIHAPYIYRLVNWLVSNGGDVYSYAGNTIYHGKQSVTITPGQWVHIDPATEEIGVNNHQACVII